MSVRDTSIDPRLLQSARNEFVKNGFIKADLKTICENAGVTTGAVYKRYKGKEELFCAVVEETAKTLEDFTKAKTEIDFSVLSDTDMYDLWVMREDDTIKLFKMLWSVRDDFYLLLERSSGTKYENFRHDFADNMSTSTYRYYIEARKRGLIGLKVSEKELHVLCSSFWTSIYEPFIHHMTWKEIISHCKIVCRFFDWTGALLIK